MTGLTTRGFPYATSGDKIADTHTRIKALADFLEARVGLMQSGSFTFPSGASGTNATQAVVFATAFPVGVVPNVVVVSNSPFANATIVGNPTNTGFTMRIDRTGTTAPTVRYIAHY